MNKTERITVAGFGGQGVMMIGQMLAYSGNDENYNSLWFPSYGPETRGGTANCAVIISNSNINSPVFSKADTLIALNGPSLDKFKTKVKKGGIIIYNSSLISNKPEVEDVLIYAVPINDIAIKIGNPKVANMVILGAYLEITNLFTDKTIEKILVKFLGEEKAHLLDINKEALKLGRKYIKEMCGKNA